MEETQASSEIPVKVIEDADATKAESIKVLNGDLPLEIEGKKEEEEANFDGEFIKVERESLDVKDGSHADETTLIEDNKPSVIERSSSNSSRELLEAREKVSDLEVEIERLAGVLKHSESENADLKNEALLTKEKLGESGKKYEELQLSLKKVEDKYLEDEEKYVIEVNTLKQELQTQEAKHKDLVGVKEAFDRLSLEIESSKKRMEELELQLQSSTGEAHKFEELHKQSGSHAESETKKALEFEMLLEAANLSAKEMEDQMALIQEELKGLYEKIAEDEKVKEVLQSSAAELSAVQEELALSKSQGVDLAANLSAKENLINELNEELGTKKASESQLKEDISALENLFAATKEDLKGKVSELEDIKLKMQEALSAKELVEDARKAHEEQIAIVTKEKEAAEAAAADLTSNVQLMKELCSDLEEKLKVSEDNFSKTDALLSQAVSSKLELEQKFQSLEELHNEKGAAFATATEKNVELEGLIQSSNAAAEEAKAQLSELEARFVAAGQKNIELEKKIKAVELNKGIAESGLQEFSEKLSALETTLQAAEEERSLLNGQVQEYQEKITQLESALNQSSLQTLELQEELKIATEKCAEHEGRASTHQQRSLELEDLIQMSHSKADDHGKKVSELELLLETEKFRIQELEEQVTVLEKKCQESEADSKNYSDKVAELASELEAFQARASSLEVALLAANEKEKELTESLDVATEEKKRLEDASNSSTAKFSESENLLEILRDELNLTREKLENMENDLMAAEIRENEVLEKLKSSQDQLEQHGKVIEERTSRNLELEALHESLKRDSEIKLQESIGSFTARDAEAKSLLEKLKILEDQVKVYEEQVAEAARQSASLKEELDNCLTKLASSESTNEDFQKQVLEAENKASQSFSEKEVLVETNVQLKSKIDELQELLNSTVSEKEVTTRELVSHKSTIEELTVQHSRASDLHSAAEAHVVEAETNLQEAIKGFSHKDLEAKGLLEKLQEISAVLETSGAELEETLLKLKLLESTVEELQHKSAQFAEESRKLAEANIKLTEEVSAYESKVSDAEAKYSACLVEKDETFEQLQAAKKTIQDLTQQHSTEGQKLQSQKSLEELEEQLTKTEARLKHEVESLKAVAAEREAELTSKLEDHATEVHDRDLLNEQVVKLQSELQSAKITVSEKKEADSKKDLEREASLKHSLEELEAKNKQIAVLEKQLKDLEQKLQLAETKVTEKGDGAGLEVKSRDIGSSVSTPSKRKSKKKSEATLVQTSSSSEIHTHTAQASPLMTIKFFVGVAIVSAIIGIILGKRY